MNDPDPVVQDRRSQVLRLVAKAFYRELTTYGVARDEVLTVTNHLLDSVLSAQATGRELAERGTNLRLDQVRDEWGERGALYVGDVALRPLDPERLDSALAWMNESAIRHSFVPPLPTGEDALFAYLRHPSREYYAIHHQETFVGVIGAENIDPMNHKLEMKKLVGVPALRGLGIGTRATFAFLYHSFMLRKAHKVYVHSLDTNVRNLNLNSRLGFELEGIFLEDLQHEGRQIDVIRMALLKPIWLALFT